MTENYYEFRKCCKWSHILFVTGNVGWEQDWLLSCVNSQRLWNNSSPPIDTEQYMHDKIGCVGCK